jgi:hypothetical protein
MADTYIYATGNVAGSWTNPTYAYDNVTTSSASYGWTGISWSPYLTLNLSTSVRGTKIQYLCQRSSATYITNMTLQIANQTGSWVVALNNTITWNSYSNLTMASQSTYTAMRYAFYNSRSSSSYTAYLNETQAVDASTNFVYSPNQTSQSSSLSKANSFERAFNCSNIPIVSAVVSPYMIDRPYSLFGSGALSVLISKATEQSFSSKPVFQIGPLNSKTTENAFSSSALMTALASVSKALEKAFSSLVSVSFLGSISSGVERRFSLSNTVNLVDVSSWLKESYVGAWSFSLSNTFNSFANPSNNQELSSSLTNAFGISDSFSKSSENLWVSISTVSPRDLSILNHENVFNLNGNSVFGYWSQSGAERVYSVSSSVNALPSFLSNIEKGFRFSEFSSIFEGLSAFGEVTIYPPSVFSFPVTVGLDPTQLGSVPNLNPLLIVETSMPPLVSSIMDFSMFLFTMNYPVHIQAVCASPATSTVDVTAITIVTIPSLNYMNVLNSTLSGSQSITEDVIVPLPLMNQGSYDYQVSTTYLFGNTLITQSSMDGTLTVQWWWIWMWAGLVAGLILSFIGITVGAYFLHKRRLEAKAKLLRAQQKIRQLQRT